MEDKEKIKNELQNTINELGKLMVLKEQISSNWNDVIATAFTTKYNSMVIISTSIFRLRGRRGSFMQNVLKKI